MRHRYLNVLSISRNLTSMASPYRYRIIQGGTSVSHIHLCEWLNLATYLKMEVNRHRRAHFPPASVPRSTCTPNVAAMSFPRKWKKKTLKSHAWHKAKGRLWVAPLPAQRSSGSHWVSNITRLWFLSFHQNKFGFSRLSIFTGSVGECKIPKQFCCPLQMRVLFGDPIVEGCTAETNLRLALSEELLTIKLKEGHTPHQTFRSNLTLWSQKSARWTAVTWPWTSSVV